MNVEYFRNLFYECLEEEGVDGWVPKTTRDRALCFALILLAEDNIFYGNIEDITSRELPKYSSFMDV